MKEIFLYLFGYLIFFYSIALIASYVVMNTLAYLQLRRYHDMGGQRWVRKLLESSPYTPGVSIVAAAYNEENVVISCVESFLQLDYPLFEVVIVNDGSTDRTLELLIEHFELQEVPFAYNEQLRTKPFRRLFKSTSPAYHRLTVVDKENGGTKADPINAGLNVAQYPYFINTDVDCILSREAIYHCIRPVLEQRHVIAVSGVMAMSNGCKIEQGKITARRVPHSPSPLFQAMEYLRSFMIGKMAWSRINAMPNVSGGYGLFDREVALAAGGYNPDSFAEDMDMLIRMVRYCCDFGKRYRVVQVPETCCWTQGPPNISVLYKQRVRWGRGLIQTMSMYFRMLLRPKYRRMGMITLPYIFVFEFMAPVIEVSGFVAFVYLAFTGGVNWPAAGIIVLCVLLFNYLVAVTTCYYDYLMGITYGKKRSYFWLAGAALLEPLLYHPLIVLFSLKGYFNYLAGLRAKWGEMKRKKYYQEEGEANEPPERRGESRGEDIGQTTVT